MAGITSEIFITIQLRSYDEAYNFGSVEELSEEIVGRDGDCRIFQLKFQCAPYEYFR